MFDKILENVKREPVLISVLTGDSLALAVAFGLELTKDQTAGILTLIGTLTVFIFGRSNVTPNVSVVAVRSGDQVVAADASPLPNGSPVDVTEYVGRHLEE